MSCVVSVPGMEVKIDFFITHRRAYMKNDLYNKFGLWTKVCIVICLFCGMGRFGNVNVAGAADTKKTGVTESVTESASYLEKAGYQSMSAVDPGFDKLTQMIQKIESRTSLRAHKVEGTKINPLICIRLTKSYLVKAK